MINTYLNVKTNEGEHKLRERGKYDTKLSSFTIQACYCQQTNDTKKKKRGNKQIEMYELIGRRVS